MADFDASTPQLKAVKNWLDAYCTLNMENVGSLISKNFQYQAFPETPEIPKETKKRHIERYKDMFSAANKFEVCAQRRRTAFKLAD